MKINNYSVGFIATIFNEEKAIGLLLNSLLRQTKTPDSIVIVDGGSRDNTLMLIESYVNKFPKGIMKVIVKKGNRSIGRNEAIKNCKTDVVTISDSGCMLDKNWISEISKPFDDPTIDVVAGFYMGKYQSALQEAVIPYVLVMPDKVNENNFLPATRSMAIRKKAFLRSKGFDEELSHNEDYEFSRRLKKNNYKIAFTKKAIVTWFPPKEIKAVFIMFFRFALGDMEAGIIRPKVLLLFFRYLIFISLFLYALHSVFYSELLISILLIYCCYSIFKNAKYMSSYLAVLFLPFIQFLADFSVIFGSLVGIVVKCKKIISHFS